MKLIACAQCRSHVRTQDSICPWCSSPMKLPTARGALGAAALGVALLAAPGCGDSEPERMDVVQVAPYGIAPFDSGAEDVPDAGTDDVGTDAPEDVPGDTASDIAGDGIDAP